MTSNGKDLRLAICNDSDSTQQWVWNEIFY